MLTKSHGTAFCLAFGFLILLFLPAAAKTSGDPRADIYALIREIALQHKVDPALVRSIIAAESGYNRFAVSSKGAQGLMQLMPETAKCYGVKDVFDETENIAGGVKYLKDLHGLFEGQTNLILAAYNAGQEAVKKWGGIPPYPETKEYIERVMKSYKKRAPIYAFTDDEGTLVVTNIARLARPTKGPSR